MRVKQIKDTDFQMDKTNNKYSEITDTKYPVFEWLFFKKNTTSVNEIKIYCKR